MCLLWGFDGLATGAMVVDECAGVDLYLFRAWFKKAEVEAPEVIQDLAEATGACGSCCRTALLDMIASPILQRAPAK